MATPASGAAPSAFPLSVPAAVHARAIADPSIAADRDAANVMREIRKLQRSGAITLQAIAAGLKHRHVPTANGGKWHKTTVAKILARVKI